jgi:hypothetical protein
MPCLRSRSQLAQKSGLPGSFLLGELTALKISISPISHSGSIRPMLWIHFCCCDIDLSSFMNLGFPCLGNGAAHRGLDVSTLINQEISPTHMPSGQPNRNKTSLRLSSRLILSYVKLSTKAKHHTIPVSTEKSGTVFCCEMPLGNHGPQSPKSTREQAKDRIKISSFHMSGTNYRHLRFGVPK